MLSTKELNAQCHHTDKYEISTDGEPVPDLPYPSRLGFLHNTEVGPTISYIDLNKRRCRTCCDSLVSEGKYLVWSVLAGTSAANVAETLAAILPGDGHFPPILQAGSESNASHNPVLPIPDVPGAREAWQWLECQSKPFYIDQLHMVVGRTMSPLARKRAAKDSMVALRYGQVFSLSVLRSPSAASTTQPAQLAQTTQDTTDSPSLVMKKTASKKTASKKDSAKKDSEEKKPEEKSKKEKKERKSNQTTDVTISPAKHSTKSRSSKSSTELLGPTDADSNVSKNTTKTSSTDTLVAVETTTRRSSTTNLVTELMPFKSKLAGAPTASANISNKKGTSSDFNAPPVIKTTVKTFSRSWGWSEPFEFTTGPRKVPALSDYERVAESRAPSQSTTNSLDSFLQDQLKLDVRPKLHGPGDTKTVPRKAGATAASSLPKESTALQLLDAKASKSKIRDKDTSTKKKSKDSDATRDPRKPTSDSLQSGSSVVRKPSKSHETTKKEISKKSTECKKTDQLGLKTSSKASIDKSSEQSKQQVRKYASSTSSQRADKTATDVSTHRKTSVHRTSEAHDTSIKVKSTSSQAGSFTGVFKAGSNYLQHERNEAAEKTDKKSKYGKEKMSKPKAKLEGHAHHETHGHSDDSDLEVPGHSASKPSQPGKSEVHDSSQPSKKPSKADLPDRNAPGSKPLDPTSKSQPIPGKHQSDESPVKTTKTGPSTGLGGHDHKTAHEPKRTRSKKHGSHIAHEKPDKDSGALQPRSRPEHAPKRPHAVAGGKGHRSGIAAAGALAGVAAGAAVISIAEQTDVDDGSSSDSDSDTTHGDAFNDDDGTSSEGSDAEEAADGFQQDGSTTEHDQSDDSGDSSGEDTPGDDEEDQDDDSLDSDSDNDNGPDQADETDSGASSSEDNDEEPSMRVDSSDGENTDEDPSGDEEDAEGTQYESETSGGEGEDSDNDATAQNSSEEEDDSDGDPAESSSESGDDESGQETDDGEAEQDPSSSDDNSDSSEHDDSDASNESEASDED